MSFLPGTFKSFTVPSLTAVNTVHFEANLLNYITLIPVDPARFQQVRLRETMQFVAWLQSREAQTIIGDFGKDKYGEPLFFPNSADGKKL